MEVAYTMENFNRKVKIPAVIKEALLNGTSINSNASQGERTITYENLPIIPFPKVFSNKNARTHNFVISREPAMNARLMVLITRNAVRNNLTDHELAVWRAVLYVAITSGYMKSDALARFPNNQEQFENLITAIDLNAIPDDISEQVELAYTYVDIANNIISASVINFIRFNHHFGSNIINLNYKMFLPIDRDELPNFINDRNEFLNPFYETIYPVAKLVNEILWYYRVILNNAQRAPNIEYPLLDGPVYNQYITVDRIIIIRAVPTVNIFTPISIIRLIIAKLEDLNLAPLITTGTMAAKINMLDTNIRNNPFSYHPSKDYFRVSAPDYNQATNLKNYIVERLGGLTASFCDLYGGTLQNARSVAKYLELVTPLQTAIITFYFELRQTGIRLNEDIKNLVRAKNMIALREINTIDDLNNIINDYGDTKIGLQNNDLYTGI